jgi:hypothetical protein
MAAYNANNRFMVPSSLGFGQRPGGVISSVTEFRRGESPAFPVEPYRIIFCAFSPVDNLYEQAHSRIDA